MRLRDVVLGEVAGTFLLVFFGCGAIAAGLLSKARYDLWQVAVVWGIGLALGIYLSSSVSGAHLNPAVTVALLIRRREIGPRTAVVYILSQLTGAILAALLIYLLFGNAIGEFESLSGITRGGPGSQLSAMMFGEYFPDPGLPGAARRVYVGTGVAQALLVEAVGTFFLALVVMSATGRSGMSALAQALVIGGVLAVLVSVLSPLTQAGLNPARDFGPRLVSYFAGWRSVAIPGPGGGFWIYIVGPILGAFVAGGLYERILRPRMPA